MKAIRHYRSLNNEDLKQLFIMGYYAHFSIADTMTLRNGSLNHLRIDKCVMCTLYSVHDTGKIHIPLIYLHRQTSFSSSQLAA